MSSYGVIGPLWVNTTLFVQQLFRATNKEVKAPYYMPFWIEPSGGRWIPKRPLRGKRFYVMTSYSSRSFTDTELIEFRIKHDDVIKRKHSLRYFEGIHWSPVDSPHNGQWRGALIYSLIRDWAKGWANNRDAGDLRRHRANYDVNGGWHLVNMIS